MLWMLVPIALAVIELGHPAWSDGSVARAVSSAGGWWIPLHVLLVAGYGLLTVRLWRDLPPNRLGALARALFLIFGLSNTVFVAVDGIVVGLQAVPDPTAADALWTSPWVGALANVTGAAWSGALLSFAAAVSPGRSGRAQLLGLALIWLTFVASAAVPGAAVVSRALAIAVGAWTVYRQGVSSVPFAVLVFAAVLRQHVGAEAALGLLLLAVAFGFRERSGPAVAFQL